MPHALWNEAREAGIAAALTAWEAIAGLYESGSHIDHGPDGPSTEADKLADRILKQDLQKNFPLERFGYLTEETEDDRSRLDRDRLWIIDPIDGTKDFIQKNGNFSIHIGYAERNAQGLFEPVAAVVYRPFPGEMYSAVKGEGSRIDPCEDNRICGPSRPMRVSDRREVGRMRCVISNSHRSSKLSELVKWMGFEETLPIGSIGIKVSLIARGDYDVYVNLARGRCKEWDVCAPQLILTEAGGKLTGLDGSFIHYNKQDVRDSAGLLATNDLTHEELMSRIAEFEANYQPRA